MVNRKLKIHHFSPLTPEKCLSYPGSENNDANQEIMGFLDITSSGTCSPTNTHQQKQCILSFLLTIKQNPKLTLKDLKTESIRKLSNFNSQWTKPLYQNILSHIIFFFTLLKGYRCNQLSVITPKTISYGRPRKKISNFTGTEKRQVKLSCARLYFMKFEASEDCFWGSNKNLFFRVISYNLLHLQPLKSVKRMP